MIRPWLVAAFVAAGALPAHAHVTVWPMESRAGASERYTVRVPTEGNVPTTSIELEVPAGVVVSGVLVGAGYSYELQRDGGRIPAAEHPILMEKLQLFFLGQVRILPDLGEVQLE